MVVRALSADGTDTVGRVVSYDQKLYELYSLDARSVV